MTSNEATTLRRLCTRINALRRNSTVYSLEREFMVAGHRTPEKAIAIATRELARLSK